MLSVSIWFRCDSSRATIHHRVGVLVARITTNQRIDESTNRRIGLDSLRHVFESSQVCINLCVGGCRMDWAKWLAGHERQGVFSKWGQSSRSTMVWWWWESLADCIFGIINSNRNDHVTTVRSFRTHWRNSFCSRGRCRRRRSSWTLQDWVFEFSEAREIPVIVSISCRIFFRVSYERKREKDKRHQQGNIIKNRCIFPHDKNAKKPTSFL